MTVTILYVADADEPIRVPIVLRGRAYALVLGREGRTWYAVDDNRDVYKIVPYRQREWFCRLSNWNATCVVRRIRRKAQAQAEALALAPAEAEQAEPIPLPIGGIKVC